MGKLDLDRMPFSRCGSWLSIARLRGDAAPDGVDGLYLQRVQGRLLWSAPIGRLAVLRNGREVDPAVEADEWLLRFTDKDGGWIEICFDRAQTLRLRGSGLGLRIDAAPEIVTYSEADGRATLNVPAVLRRYEIEALDGRLVLDGHWRDAVPGRAHVELLPGDDGTWEAAVDEFTSTWTPKVRGTFGACLDEVRGEFEAWLDGSPEAPDALAAARRLAAYHTWSCVVEPEGLVTRPAMLMSKQRMCSVWSWDNCFNAMALVRHDARLAWDQLLLFVDQQDESGAYADVVNAAITVFNFTKPPVHGWTVLELLRLNPNAPDRDVLERMYDSLGRWTRWWLDHRRVDGAGLPYYLHGNDAGWDNATVFDAGVPVATPDLAAYLVMQMDALGELAERLHKRTEAAQWRRQADSLLSALVDELWTGERFVAKLVHTGEIVATRCLIYTMPVILGERLPKDVLAKLTERLRDHLTEHGLASEHPDSAEYRANGYWRGPIWAPSTYMPVWALERLGETTLARTIAERFCAMCAANGFAEYFDALTGQGLGDSSYTWTSSVFLLLAQGLGARAD